MELLTLAVPPAKTVPVPALAGLERVGRADAFDEVLENNSHSKQRSFIIHYLVIPRSRYLVGTEVGALMVEAPVVFTSRPQERNGIKTWYIRSIQTILGIRSNSEEANKNIHTRILNMIIRT